MPYRIFYLGQIDRIFGPATDSLMKLTLMIAVLIQIIIFSHGSSPL